MPFKWRLKKTRKYDISTKNSFIVGVYLLDNAYLECTLNADSTGQECLNSIAQRVELVESHYFGLRYVTKKLHFHWVDLEKPLKKQLDKYAQPASHSHCLYFGVMFYIIGAHKIPDEVARYHYYLQLKNDVIDGRLPCSSEQAIRLAAYSLQAEFGDYEPDKYSVQDYLLFPKTMMKDEAVAAELLSEAIAGHASLQGVPPVRAELQYVKEVQMMDGYGAEYYSAKDESRKDLYLGTSYAGIFARYVDGQSTVYYKWAEIAKVTQNKKSLEIDTSKSSVQFQLEDSDTSKYVCRLAQLQRQFYKSSKGNLRDAQQVYIPPTDSSHSSQELGHSQTSLTHLQEQRYSHEILQSSQQSLESSSESQQIQQLQQFHHQLNQLHGAGIEPETALNNSIYQQEIMRHESLTPTPEGDPVYVNRAALLPAYRPSPDYDAVMQQRMIQQHQQQQPAQQQPQHHQQQHHQHHQQQQPTQHQQPSHFKDITPHLGAAQVYVHPDGMAYSQPEISLNISNYRDEHGNYANVDALRNYSHSIYANIFQDSHGFYAGPSGQRSTNLAVHPTYSSPELNSELHQQDMYAANEFSAQEAMAYHFRPPPPYPRTSSSTPDLAGQPSTNLMTDQSGLVVHSSADVGAHDLIVQSRLDRSVEDLSGYKSALGPHQLPFSTSDAVGRSSSNSAANQDNHNMNITSLTVEALSDGLKNSSALSENDSTLTRETAQKILIDDPDDTSSEHSYSTFHAKESDESSEEEGSRKISQPKEESKIQIRMFTPQEAPPPSKLKEEATLRESFRRLKIARTGSVNKDVPMFGRSSLRGMKEPTDESSVVSPHLNVVCEQDSSQKPVGSLSTQEVGTLPEMKEILERLGAPPPYPGKANAVNMPAPAAKNINNNNNNTVTENKEDIFKIPLNPQTKVSTNAVKRSSSVGTAPVKSSPLLPARKDMSGSKIKGPAYSLDTVVPVSKPAMSRPPKEPEISTSVLRIEMANSSSSTCSDNETNKSGEKDASNSGGGQEEDAASDTLTSLHDFSVGSDSDSDHERSTSQVLNMGPLKMAALNGLTLSRSMVLSMMNDDSRAPTDDRRRMLESKISEGQVYVEFEQIPRKADSMDCSVALAPHNAPRNRFKDVLPYDITRVKLAPTKDNPDGYINASHIKIKTLRNHLRSMNTLATSLKQLTANDNKWLFIATQAPLENTAVDFWQMIWENSVDVLAMLTPFQELGKSKCFTYWPQEPGPQHKHVYGEFEVELQFTDDSLCYLTSRIILRHAGREHMVWHLQYTDWPDHGCPEDTYGFLGFLDEIESVARLAESETGREEKSPVVVHCSAGVGRTGVVILTMVMKWCLEHNHNVDLPKALLGIRNQRMHMVQTMGQYRFIHDTLIQYLKNTRLI
ncbi:tyrosine-protein phosphatase non-receptor type 21-like isoform X2 [Physella acuta]|uniref:tyrosine-protein phosphatase non-receptor type 21-like isoform X2 n=1 Tax=Physella acuta TaxID=109671 RepID=UPI0027DDABC0|nr:tyrosine-protein phosphatase non-receptor type 21-like isoform X2 [Physella acuta]